jgi:hypothetical protein
MRLSPSHRLPRAGIDPIDSHDAALATVAMAAHRPLRPETIVVLLDDARRGIALVVVTDTHRADDVLEVVECLTRPTARSGRVGAIVVGTVRPGADASPGADGDDRLPDPDIDRWLELTDIAERHAVQLLEWVVIGADVQCPRDDLGEAPRW